MRQACRWTHLALQDKRCPHVGTSGPSCSQLLRCWPAASVYVGRSCSTEHVPGTRSARCPTGVGWPDRPAAKRRSRGHRRSEAIEHVPAQCRSLDPRGHVHGHVCALMAIRVRAAEPRYGTGTSAILAREEPQLPALVSVERFYGD